MYKMVQGSAVGLKRGLFNRKRNYWTSNKVFYQFKKRLNNTRSTRRASACRSGSACAARVNLPIETRPAIGRLCGSIFRSL